MKTQTQTQKKFMEDKEGSPEWEFYNSWCPDLT